EASVKHILVLFDIKPEAQIGRTLGVMIAPGYVDVVTPDFVIPFGQCWAGPFSIVKMSDRVPPAAPIELSIEEIMHNSILLSWEPNSEDDVVGYNIYRSLSNNPSDWGNPVESISFGDEEFNDTGLSELTKYHYVVTAYDEIPNESEYSNIVSGVTLLDPVEPEINNSIVDFSIPEDSYDDSSINLYSWFMDKNNDRLSFRCEWNKNIEVTIFQENGTVVLVPKKNWNGKETLIFFAADDKGEVGDDVVITVTPINDPPGPVKIISPSEGSIFEHGTPVDLMGSCEDADILYGDTLTFKWSSNISGPLVEGEIINAIILDEGMHLVTLEVIDMAGQVAQTSINIT
ncbi:MAG: fibronectin type III domain-containing protein, partial [Thermoplasmata archaeon]|nr:fibronectin type III domain-containing protein [Thermoplasmata archaeon]